MKIKNLRILIASIVSTVTLVAAGLGFTGALKQKSKNTDYSSWMKGLNDTTLVRNINMPGSHDTMAL